MTTKQRVQRANKNAAVALAERKAQEPDYEWLRIKHQKKMMLRSLKTMATAMDSLTNNLTGAGASLWK